MFAGWQSRREQGREMEGHGNVLARMKVGPLEGKKGRRERLFWKVSVFSVCCPERTETVT